MYLARTLNNNGEWNFFIRESYQDKNGIWRSRELFDLGVDPSKYIHYLGQSGYYFDESILEELSKKGLKCTQDDLEDIFWLFLDPEIKRIIEDFGSRSRSKKKRKRLTRAQRKELFKTLHPFDKRRICFLRFGQINMEGLIDQPLPFYRVLLFKSRDEIEQMINQMEGRLRPWERRGYLYGIFDIPSYFGYKMTRFIPDAQPLKDIDRFFLDSICQLNRDKNFFLGVDDWDKTKLHPYLQIYLFMYFDWAFKAPGINPEYGKTKPRGKTIEKYLKSMGLSLDEYENMSADDLSKYFKQQALKKHPDRGGSHEEFIILQNAYEMLLRRKTWA